MKTSKTRYYWWLLLSLNPALAQVHRPPPSTDSLTRVVAQDTGRLRVRYPAPEPLQQLRTSRDYQYERDTRPPDSLLAKLGTWFWHKVRALLSSRAYRHVGQYIVLAIIAGLTVRLLLRAEGLGVLFNKKAQGLPLEYENLTENIHEISFQDRIEEAEATRNYRLVVRLLYLQTLKQLTDRSLIDWKPDKTNRQYVHELAGSPLQASFERLTTQFERVWYGDFPVSETIFGDLRAEFTQFNNWKESVAGR